jgi:acetate kinase
VRRAVGHSLAFAGVRLGSRSDAGPEADRDVASPDSSVRVLVITAREDLSVLAEVKRLVLT